MGKITQLTADQRARLVTFRAEYFAHGTNTATADRSRAEAAFARAYRVIGREPVPVIWVDSPMTASMLFAVLERLPSEETKACLANSLTPSLWNSLRDGLRHSLRQKLAGSLSAGLRDRLRASLMSRLQESLEASLAASIAASLGAGFRASLRPDLGASLAASLHDSLVGSLRASLMSRLQDSLDAGLAASLGASLQESLRASLGTSLAAGLVSSLRASLMSRLQDSLMSRLQDNLRASLHASLISRLEDSLGARLAAGLAASLGDSNVSPQFTYWWGQQDLCWVAFYRFCAEIGVSYDRDAADRLDIMHEIGLSCMWWWPRDGLIVACERPSTVHFDERQRLHNDSGPAVSFRDGWNVYADHGVLVAPWVFETPERLTLAAIDAESNTEVQRVMIERYGWDRYAAECGAEVVEHDERWGTLYRRNSDDEPIVFLRVTNRSPEPDGTFRQYVLPVHPECQPLPDPADPEAEFGEPQLLTALNAVASTFGLRGSEYARMLGAES